ncbi:hypothetical protein [Mycobacterium sp. JS623]|uniref:hypothetical protein n=1 Tax=Mycobacterium sp. JS623 TaxID=212767 RepID=UPI0002EB6DF0|nr:hypothetical protein [Mycobacterium sp. JS623]
MTGFLQRLAARIEPDRSSVRPRPDVLLLAQLQPGIGTAAEPDEPDDELAAPSPRAHRRSSAPSAQPAAGEQPAPQQPAASSPPAPRAIQHRALDRHGPPQPPPPTPAAGAESAVAPTPSAAMPPAAPTAQPTPAPASSRSRPSADPAIAAESRRALTARPSSDPATQPVTHRSATSATPPVSITARRNESRARSDAEQQQHRQTVETPVEITIDRIDVRLPSAPQSSQPPRSGPREPMSLERYLQSRQQSRQAP